MRQPPKQVRLSFQLPKESWPKLLGEKLTEDSYDEVVDEDADVYTPEGEILFKLRKAILPGMETAKAYVELRQIETKTLNRGMATGKFATGVPAVRKGGYVSKTVEVPKEFAVMSNVIGFFDRYTRTPFCRQTAFNANEPDSFRRILPFLQRCSEVYEQEAPERWSVQKFACETTHPDWVIPGTVFTTVTVNKNFSTAIHTDQGDLKSGLSLITAIRAGAYTGCKLVFPHYRVAVDLQTRDLLLFNSHHMHGNTPLLGRLNEYERVSLVLYFREKMKQCLSATAELDRAKSRKKGDPLW